MRHNAKGPDQTSRFSDSKYINLETYTKNGEPKRTPVRAVWSNGVAYLRTGPGTWKVKRIRRNRHVRVAPSDSKGRPYGKWLDGDAQITEGEEHEQAITLFKKEYGSMRYLLGGAAYRLFRGEPLTIVISVTLRPQSVPCSHDEPVQPRGLHD